MKKTEYWALPSLERGWGMELHSQLAWELIHHFGSVAAKEDGEDGAKRQRLALQSPAELVERCFAVADIFVETAESRGEIRSYPSTEEDASRHYGELERIKSRALYPVEEMPAAALSSDEAAVRARHTLERAELRDKQRREQADIEQQQKTKGGK